MHHLCRLLGDVALTSFASPSVEEGSHPFFSSAISTFMGKTRGWTFLVLTPLVSPYPKGLLVGKTNIP